VLRLSQRLDLTRNDDPKKIEQDLIAVIRGTKWIQFSHQLIWHGRASVPPQTQVRRVQPGNALLRTRQNGLSACRPPLAAFLESCAPRLALSTMPATAANSKFAVLSCGIILSGKVILSFDHACTH